MNPFVRWLGLLLAASAVLSGAASAQSGQPSELLVPQPKTASFQLPALELTVGVGAALISVPAALALGAWIGSGSPNLLAAGLPSLILLATLPPLAVTLAEGWIGNVLSPGSARIRPALWFAIGVHIVALIAAGLLGVWAGNFGHAAVFTAIDAVVLPATVTVTMNAFAPKPVVQSGGTLMVPVASFSF